MIFPGPCDIYLFAPDTDSLPHRLPGACQPTRYSNALNLLPSTVLFFTDCFVFWPPKVGRLLFSFLFARSFLFFVLSFRLVLFVLVLCFQLNPPLNSAPPSTATDSRERPPCCAFGQGGLSREDASAPKGWRWMGGLTCTNATTAGLRSWYCRARRCTA